VKILVADDETLVRYGLISVLRDILPPSAEIIEAASGSELIEKARVSHPHIAFVDIKMPGMNGLEAISRVQPFCGNTLWVIITGHADFSYAREALKLGVEDFLLKPPDPDDMRKLLKKLQKRIREKQFEENRRLESRISAVIGDTTSIQFDPYFQKPRFWQAALIIWDSLLPDSEKVPIQQRFAVHLIEQMDDEEEYSGTLVSMRDGRLLLVFSMAVEASSMDRVIDYWNGEFRKLKADSGKAKDRGIADTWLLTRVTTDVEGLFSEVDKLNEMSSLRYLHHPGNLTPYNDLIGNHRILRYSGIAGLLEELSRTWELGREDDYHGIIHKLEDAVRLIPGGTTVVDNPAWFTSFVFPLHDPAPDSLRDLVQRLHNDSHEIFENRPASGKSNTLPESLVDKATLIMNRRYRETLGIAQVAEELGVSPNYLSTVIKKETGRSFTRHLTELRLDKSRELLKKADANIGSIARSLGYQSGRHFTRLFKERFGMTPSQWMLDNNPDRRI